VKIVTVTVIYQILVLALSCAMLAGTRTAALAQPVSHGQDLSPQQSTQDSPNDEQVVIDPDPEDFARSVDVDNPYFPLTPGATLIYEGNIEGAPARNEFAVTHETKVIQGVTTIVVDDKDFLNGKKNEETRDWYAQDDDGNVWYFGEATDQLDEQGKVVGHEGSWEAGVNGAHAGIVMEGEPRSQDTYFQEFAPGIGEDRAIVRSLHKTVSVPYGRFTNCLKTKEFSRLDPGVFEQKYYGRGIGLLKSAIMTGAKEQFALVTIIRGK
jgi:hypothetical protein